MESSSQPDLVTRRRALHFDADAAANNNRPLVTRPGRSRGHLHRVDPYLATQAQDTDNAQSLSLLQTLPRLTPVSSFNDAGSVASSHASTGGLSHAADHAVASIADSSSHSSSSSSSSSSSPGRNNGVDTDKTRITPKKRVASVSRSISWANAINVGHSRVASASASVSTDVAANTSTSTSTPIANIGIGIGSINHHHPLKQDVLPTTTAAAQAALSKASPSIHTLVTQRGLNGAVQYTLRLQSRRLSSAIAKRKFAKNISSQHRILILVLPFALIFFSGLGRNLTKHTSKKIDKITQPPGFKWTPDRRLNNRKCVLNMFIDKQEPDEFNPDYKAVKPGEKNKDGTPKLHPSQPKLEPGTYRTKGQTEVILRFISSIADSFRPNLKIQQHLVFAGARDGGHLAEEALKLWPPRGRYRTKLYVIADSEDAPALKNRDHSDRALEYGPIDAIEQRFQNHKKSSQVHIFDNEGQKAGLVNSFIDDDDVAMVMEEEMFHVEDDEFGSDVNLGAVDDDVVVDAKKQKIGKGRRTEGGGEAGDGQEARATYFSLKKLLRPYLDRDGDGDGNNANDNDNADTNGRQVQVAASLANINSTQHGIPYLHVDGTTAAQQFAILQSAKPFLLDKTVSIVGVENSGDMDVDDLIEFFHSVDYKTFLLGKRQVMRIDHLCRETLDDLMGHPFISPKKPGFVRKILQKLNIVSRDHYASMEHPHPNHHMIYPPFFVAFPRGRTSKEEMTIQHMYDLFGGSGGGGMIATANDRKAPTKKKKT